MRKLLTILSFLFIASNIYAQSGLELQYRPPRNQGTLNAYADSTRFIFPDTTLAKASHKILPFDMTDGRFLEIDGMTGESAYQRFIEKVKGTSWYKDEGRFPRRGVIQLHTAGADSVIILDTSISPVDTFMVFDASVNSFLASGTLYDVDFKDGVLYLGASNGVKYADFMRDRLVTHQTGGYVDYNGNILQRNDGKDFVVLDASIAIVNNTVNAVSVIRDPEGATDEFGRRLPRVSVETAGGTSFSNAGITAFYDGTARAQLGSWYAKNGMAFFIDDQTGVHDNVRIVNSWNSIGADAWSWADAYQQGGAKADALPWGVGNFTITSITGLDGQSVVNGVDPVVMFGSENGLAIGHTLKSGVTNGITIDIDTDNNIARSDTLAWDLGSVNGVFNNALTASGAGVTYGDGVIGWGAVTDGTDYLQRHNDSALNLGTDDWAITFWFLHPATATDDAIFQLYGHPDVVRMYFPTGTNVIRYQVTDDNFSTTDSFDSPASSFDDGLWHHHTFMRDGSTFKAFIDGVQIGSTAVSNASASIDPDSLDIFSIDRGSIVSANGAKADQFAVWKRALVNNEVVWLKVRGDNANGNLTDYLGANDVDYASADPNANTFTFGNQDTVYHTTTSGLPLARIPSAGGNVTDAHVIASGDTTAIYQATSTKTKVYQPDLTVQQLAQDKGVEFARPIANIKRFVSPSNLHLFDAIVDSAGYGDYTTFDDAIDAGAKSIFGRKGTYPPFDADVAGLYIVGESWDVIIDGGTTDDAIDITATKVTIENLSVKTTSLGGNAFGGVEVSSAGTYATARKVRVIESDDTGFYSEGADFTVESCIIEDTDGIGIQPNALRGRILNNLIITTGSTCINITANGDNFIIVGNSIHEGTQTSIGINTNGDNGIVDGNIVNTAISDAGTGNTIGDNETY